MTAKQSDGGTAVSRIKGDPEPVVCGVCRRRATTGFGWAGRQGNRIMWLCDDPICGQLARTVYEMPKLKLDAFEEAARDDAGEMAGSYLDSIGKTDLATLTADEWATLLHQVIVGFEASLRRRILGNAAPF